MRFWITSLLILHFSLCLGQVDIAFSSTGSPQFHPDQLWQIEVSNQQREGIRVYLRATILNAANQPVLQVRSNALGLPRGPLDLRRHPLQTVSIEHPQGPEALKEGTYSICLEVIEEDIQRQIGRACQSRQIESWSEQQSKASGNTKKLAFSGDASISAQLSNRQSLFQEIPPNYLRLQARPRIQLMGIPLQGQVNLTTEQSGLRYDLNAVGLSLNRTDLLNTLSQQLQQRLEAEKEQLRLGAIAEGAIQNKIKSYTQKLRQELENQLGQDWEKILQQQANIPNEIRQIQQVLDLDEMRSVEGEWKQWVNEFDLDERLDWRDLRDTVCARSQEKCAKFVRLLSKREQLLKLQKRATELAAMLKNRQLPASISQKLQQLRAIESGDLSSLTQNTEQLEKLLPLSRLQKIATKIRSFQIGTAFPQLSPLSLDGVAIKGTDLEVQPGKYFAGFTAGILGRQVGQLNTSSVQTKDWLVNGRAGLGDPDKSHVQMVYQFAQQGAQESDLDPQKGQNTVLGLRAGLNLLDDRLRISGEWMYAQSSFLRQDSSLAVWPRSLAPQGEATQGQAWNLNGQLNIWKGGDLTGRYAQIGRNYFSLGAPFLLTDRERYEVRFAQSFGKGIWTLGGFVRRDADRLDPDQIQQTAIESAGLQLRFQPKKAPYIQLEYAPYAQKGNLAEDQQAGLSLLNVQSGWQYRLGTINGNTQLIYSQQFVQTADTNVQQTFGMLALQQSLMIGSVVSGNGSVSMIRHAAGQVMTWQASLTAHTPKWGSYTIGSRRGQDLFLGGAERTAFSFSAQIPLGKSLSWECFVEKSLIQYGDQITPDYDEYIVQSAIRFRW